MVRALTEDDMTAYDLAKVVGLTVNCVRRYLAEAKADGLIYIAGWYRASARGLGHYMPRYRYGNKPDKPRPSPVSGAARQVAYKRRLHLRRLERVLYRTSYRNGKRV